MKRFSQYLTEAMSGADIHAQAQTEMDSLQKELQKVMGSSYVVKVMLSKNLGLSAVVIVHDTKPANNIWQNSPVAVHLIAHLQNSSLKPTDVMRLSWESLGHTRREIGFRKISSDKSIADLNAKLLKWFKSTKPKMDARLGLKESINEDVREIKGVFDKINLSRIHRLKPFKVGDTLISRKGEKFTVTKIEPRKVFKDGTWFPEGESIDIVGSNKGKVFTIIVR